MGERSVSDSSRRRRGGPGGDCIVGTSWHLSQQACLPERTGWCERSARLHLCELYLFARFSGGLLVGFLKLCQIRVVC